MPDLTHMPKAVRCFAGWLCLAAHIHALSQRSTQSLVLQTRPLAQATPTAEGQKNMDNTSEKRKVGGSTPPLTTRSSSNREPSHLR